MPIEKERLFALLNAGENLEMLLLSNAQSILLAIKRAKQGQTSLEDALNFIGVLQSTLNDTTSQESKALLRERIRWNLTHKRNDRAKRYHEARRRQDGVPTRQPPRPQAINFDTPSISTQQFLREMEALGMTTEEALREFERKHTEEDEAPSQIQVQTPPQTPGDPSRFIEDSDDFAPPQGEG